MIGVVVANVTPPMAMLRFEVATSLLASVVLTVNVGLVPIPAAVGVPEMIPVPGARLNPPGRLPELTDQA